MSKLIRLAGQEIGAKFPPYFIAEMSGNHNQSLDKALEIVDLAATSGADALKIQTYTPDTMTIDFNKNEFFISDEKSLWKGNSLYDLYKKAHTPWEWHKPIQQRCNERGIVFFSTPFDATAVDFLEELNVPFYKIASFEIVDLPLIKRTAATGKPLIMSTGMSSVGEIWDAVNAARSAGAKDIILLKCTSAYPATAADANLKSIPVMKETFGVEVGLSDHTMGTGVALAAITLGATVVEKHFTGSRADGGVDSTFSMEPEEFRLMVQEGKKSWESLGQVKLEISEVEKKSLIYRRSIYVVDRINKGEVLTEKNIRIIRPGYGLAPKFIDEVLGKRATRDLEKGTALTWDLFL
jgi:pseudaminic acid synthase